MLANHHAFLHSIILGMVKSGVEGNDIVLLKLEKKIVFSDFARPICLPETDDWTNSIDSECYSLGWDNKVQF